MFNFKIKKDNNSDNKTQDIYKKYRIDKEETLNLFEDYVDLEINLGEELFLFMYKNILNIKDTMIVASYLRQVEVPLDEIKRVYFLSDEYINNIITNIVPELRVKANKMITETIPNIPDSFGWNNGPGFILIYSEFVDRIEYLFEVARNQKKIQNEINNEKIVNKIKNNSAILVLLNYFSLKESLIIAINLGLVDEFVSDEINKIYIFSEDDFNDLLNSSDIGLLKDLLLKRIDKLKSIEPETSYLDYKELGQEYENLLNAINDSKEYISSIKNR